MTTTQQGQAVDTASVHVGVQRTAMSSGKRRAAPHVGWAQARKTPAVGSTGFRGKGAAAVRAASPQRSALEGVCAWSACSQWWALSHSLLVVCAAECILDPAYFHPSSPFARCVHTPILEGDPSITSVLGNRRRLHRMEVTDIPVLVLGTVLSATNS
jgi:hypothetical protein